MEPLIVKRTGPGQYRVGDHWVNLYAPEVEGRCDCGDYLWRNALCKHIQAAQREDALHSQPASA